MAVAPEHILSKRTVTGAYTDYDLSLADAASGKGPGNLHTHQISPDFNSMKLDQKQFLFLFRSPP